MFPTLCLLLSTKLQPLPSSAATAKLPSVSLLQRQQRLPSAVPRTSLTLLRVSLLRPHRMRLLLPSHLLVLPGCYVSIDERTAPRGPHLYSRHSPGNPM